MLNLRPYALIVMACAIILLGASHEAHGQRVRPPRVYNPRTYNNTRRQLSNRAAARVVVKKRHKAKVKGRSSPRRSTRKMRSQTHKIGNQSENVSATTAAQLVYERVPLR